MLKALSVFLVTILALLFVGCEKTPKVSEQPSVEVNRIWHTVTLDFKGPNTSESAELNPFLDYRLDVTFTHESGTSQKVQGFYAADGNAAQTGADSGAIWQVRFTPNLSGTWHYTAALYRGKNIALDHLSSIKPFDITNSDGSFGVSSLIKVTPDFRTEERGRLITKNGYFVFEKSQNIWLKGGTNSPENFLAFEGIDQTYRLEKQARTGEASAKDKRIHSF